MRQDPVDIADPSADAPDGSGLYPATGQRDALDGLRAAIDAREHVLCLTGPAGSGKTALLQELRRGCDRGVVALIERPAPGRLLNDLATALRLDVAEGNEALLRRRIVMLLATADQQHQPIVQMIDNADALSTVDLNLLLHFFPRGHATLLLAGEGTPEAWLAGCETAAGPVRIDRHFRLGLWSAEDAAGYVRHRLRQARLPETLLAAAAVDEMHRRSEGLPGTLERLATEALQAAGIPAAQSPGTSAPGAMPPQDSAAATAPESQIGAQIGAQTGERPAPATLRRLEADPPATTRRLSSEAIDRIMVPPKPVPAAERPASGRAVDESPGEPTQQRRAGTPAPSRPAGSDRPPSADRRSADALAQARGSTLRAPGRDLPDRIDEPPDAATPAQPVAAQTPLSDARRPTGPENQAGADRPIPAKQARSPSQRISPATLSIPSTAPPPGALPARTRRLRRSARRWRALAILSSLALAVVLTKDLWIDRIPTNSMLLERMAAWLNEPPADSGTEASSPPTSPTPPAAVVESPPAPTVAESDAESDTTSDPGSVASQPPASSPEAPVAPAPSDAAERDNGPVSAAPPSAPDARAPTAGPTDPAAAAGRDQGSDDQGETPEQGADSAENEPPLTPAQREEVARLYADRAEYEWRRGELDAAYLSIQRGLASDPANPRLLEMRALLRGLMQQER